MPKSLPIALSFGFLLACRPASHEEAFGRILQRGGELADVQIDQRKPSIGPHAVSAWGVLEVPDGARMQAAHAGVDAIARSELLKLVRVRIADVMVSVDSTDPARREAHEHTVEVAAGRLRRAGQARHAWERVQQGERVIMRVWSCLTIPRAEFDQALREASTAGDLQLPPDARQHLDSDAD
jgi:hypothetical protein